MRAYLIGLVCRKALLLFKPQNSCISEGLSDTSLHIAVYRAARIAEKEAALASVSGNAAAKRA